MTVGGTTTAFYVYDPSGNVWIDRNSKNTYTINALGLPSRVRLFSNDPVNSTYDDVLSDAYLTGQIGFTDMAYDEGGQRIWTKFVVDAPAHETKVTYPGIGEYTYFGQYHSDNLTLTRVDLLGGGYRTGLKGEALFPVKDLQGSIRGYVNKTGLKSAFGYRPYGTTIDLARYSSESDERWQGKTFDGEHGKYYFGARYYDSFFGMWMSPDPAGQFANPYSYGGDPLNYIDPTGMWAIGLGLVIGYDKSHGWSFGFGAAVEVGDFGVNASFSFNEDGSKSFNLSVNASIPVLNTGLWFDAGIGLNVNTYTGASFSRSGGVCYGASKEVACAGVEVGQGFSWDRSGGFNGMTVYAEAYVTYAGVRVGAEAGLFGAEGRGLYAGIGGYGLHAQVSQNGGFGWGFEERAYIGYGNNTVDDMGNKKGDIVSMELWLPTLGRFGHFTFGDTYDVSPEGGAKAQNEYIKGVRESLGELNSEEDYLYYLKPNQTYTKEQIEAISSLMKRAGYSEDIVKANTFFNKHEGDKHTFYKPSIWGGYGNVELIVGGEKNYASFNYGNHWWTHLLIDWAGYKLRKW